MSANRSASEVQKLAEAPLNFGKGSRACLYCKLVQTYEQVSCPHAFVVYCVTGQFKFIDNGCGNCVTLNMKGDKDRVSELTTSNYSGYDRSVASRFYILNILQDGVTVRWTRVLGWQMAKTRYSCSMLRLSWLITNQIPVFLAVMPLVCIVLRPFDDLNLADFESHLHSESSALLCVTFR